MADLDRPAGSVVRCESTGLSDAKVQLDLELLTQEAITETPFPLQASRVIMPSQESKPNLNL